MALTVEYRLITNLHKNSWTFLHKETTDYVPRENNIINIAGNPFVVYRVSSATGGFIYVKVFKAGDFIHDTERDARLYQYSSMLPFKAFPLLIDRLEFEDPLGEIKEFKRVELASVSILTMQELINYLQKLGTDMDFWAEDSNIFYKTTFPIERLIKINSNLVINFYRLPLDQ